MSRSYKKYPIVRQERVDSKMSNRYVRHILDAELSMKGTDYKKIKRSGWNWAYRWSLEDAKQNYNNNVYLQKKYTLEEYLIWYKKKILCK